MDTDGFRKAIHFDLDTATVESTFGKKNTSMAYRKIRKFLESNGFAHSQYSGYMSLRPMSDLEVYRTYDMMKEALPWLAFEGTQYEVFKGKVTNTERPGAGNKGNNSAISIGDYWWERSVAPYNYNSFFIVNDSGNPSDGAFAAYSLVVCPVFCF